MESTQHADNAEVPLGDDFGDILAAAKAGQEWAVGALYDAMAASLLRYLTWEERAEAEDIAGETWLAVAERIARFEGDEAAFRSRLFAIARRRLADHRRRGARRRTVPVPGDELASISGAPDPADLVVEKLSGDEALALLTRTLPADQAEVVVLRVVGGLSVEETAAALGKRAGNVRVLQHRALKRLAREFSPEFPLQV